MKEILKVASLVGLGLTLIPSFMVAFGVISWQAHASLMLLGTLIWFGSAPFWMRRKTG